MSNQKASGLFVLFGGTGDLAEGALLPAFHKLYRQGKLSEHFALVAASRSEMSNEEYRDLAREAVENTDTEDSLADDFFQHLFYQATDNTELEDFEQLSEAIQKAAKEFEVTDSFVYYYSIPPSVFDETTTNLKESGILDLEGNHRVVVEKPFGEDSESAEEYYGLLKNAFNEDEIYLVDHYLGINAVQKMMSLRYYNPALDGIWNNDYIEHVQISLPENFSIGTRGAFYDENGALLDMFQNHLLQILSTVAMDVPDELTAEKLNKQKLSLLKNITSFTKDEVEQKVVRGQYKGYREEEEVEKDSLTETYVAIEVSIDSERWRGVPFYVRTGKCLEENHNTVDVILRSRENTTFTEPNRITFSIQPETGISMILNQADSAQTKPVALHPEAGTSEEVDLPEAYETILYDVLQGDRMHFTTYAQVKEQWRITDSIRSSWKELSDPDFPNYEKGEVGPKEAEELLSKSGYKWLYRT
ncbi:glucose-6-phosphate dehydrogenase [Jeotgalibaca caeni]|uniref:glucose-6-phosphate dehydrogenase n=1 Tax=Jeotgalibaca caeni TaxID=3028623 RepID=UPI00237DB05C|nr:glucose-6-phosphate dehydrogenase [Jeotgalibaca caeni]MDE1549286.1 glucose-6-phosphate dehydrogenase [Jeotgalibaca caeni]